MFKTDHIDEAARACAEGKEVAFVLTKENKWSLFTFSRYQLKYRTARAFKEIIYSKEKDMLYYILKTFSLMTFHYYRLRYEPCVSAQKA